MEKKYIFVTGGVVSGLGKGITAASLGRLLKARGLKVSRLETWLEDYNANPQHQPKLDLATIALLFAATDDWEEIRSRQKELAAALTSAETSLKNEKTAHEEHQQHKPDKTKEELAP